MGISDDKLWTKRKGERLEELLCTLGCWIKWFGPFLFSCRYWNGKDSNKIGLSRILRDVSQTSTVVLPIKIILLAMCCAKNF